MFLDDPLQNGWCYRVVPGTLRIHHRDRSLLANAEAIRFRPVYTFIRPRQTQLFQTALEVVPRSESFFFRSAHGFRLVRAQEDVAPDVFDFQLLDQLFQIHALYLSLGERRRDAALRRLFERVTEFNEALFTAGHAGKADAERSGLWIKTFWEGTGVRHHRKRDDDCRITGAGRERGAV